MDGWKTMEDDRFLFEAKSSIFPAQNGELLVLGIVYQPPNSCFESLRIQVCPKNNIILYPYIPILMGLEPSIPGSDLDP